ncbi:hypothetical protein MVI01_43740 [Myxococcus virescens]|uniref:Uncharacterized protein n=1 Tax=Myxococcus virescens TaxID=83456 RepID=A0A511HGA1_9BACT|nr:hypothetical protein MVI01_43740 [Myxococcus virescens]
MVVRLPVTDDGAGEARGLLPGAATADGGAVFGDAAPRAAFHVGTDACVLFGGGATTGGEEANGHQREQGREVVGAISGHWEALD